MLLNACQVQVGIQALLALLLGVPCRGYLSGGGGGVRFAAAGLAGQLEGFIVHGQVQVDAVEQGAREFAAIALYLFWRAAAAARGVSLIAAAARASFRVWTYRLTRCLLGVGMLRYCP